MAKQDFVKGYLTEIDYLGNKIGESVPLTLDTRGKGVQVPSALDTYFKNYINTSKDVRFKNKSLKVKGDSGLKDSMGNTGVVYIEIFNSGEKGEIRIRNSIYYCFERDSFVKSQTINNIPTYTTSHISNSNADLFSFVG